MAWFSYTKKWASTVKPTFDWYHYNTFIILCHRQNCANFLPSVSGVKTVLFLCLQKQLSCSVKHCRINGRNCVDGIAQKNAGLKMSMGTNSIMIATEQNGLHLKELYNWWLPNDCRGYVIVQPCVLGLKILRHRNYSLWRNFDLKISRKALFYAVFRVSKQGYFFLPKIFSFLPLFLT